MFANMDSLHAIAGLLVGFLVGVTGVGGGSLMTPILVLLFGVSPQTAVGTDLLFAATTKIVGSGVHGWRSTVDWKIVRRLASGSVPAAVLTLLVLSRFGKVGKEASEIILVVLGGMLILTSIATLFQKKLAVFAKTHERLDERESLIPTIALGSVLGVAVTISSVGAGAIGVTALLMLYPALRVSKIVGSDIAHAVPLTLVAGFPLADRRGRPDLARQPADRLDSGGDRRQPVVLALARPYPAPGPGGGAAVLGAQAAYLSGLLEDAHEWGATAAIGNACDGCHCHPHQHLRGTLSRQYLAAGRPGRFRPVARTKGFAAVAVVEFCGWVRHCICPDASVRSNLVIQLCAI